MKQGRSQESGVPHRANSKKSKRAQSIWDSKCCFYIGIAENGGSEV